MRLVGALASTEVVDESTGITVDPDASPIPKLGLGAPSHPTTTSPRDLELLRLLRLDHLRVDLDLADAGAWVAALREGASLAARLGAAIELALTVSEETTDFAELVREIGDLNVEIARVLVFSAQHKSTPAGVMRSVRDALGGTIDAPLVGGTNAYFAEINRDRPDPRAMDGIVFSISPQVHAFDDASLIETLPAQANVVESARAMAEGLPIHVSPVTLRPRFNPNATALDDDGDADALPVEVDPRQRMLFGAVWTLGSFANLAAAGAAAVTYFETTGWRGVIEASAGPRGSDLFGAAPGEAFPLFHVLADLREGSPTALRHCRIEDPAKVQAVALATPDGVRVLIGNVTRSDLTVRLEGLPEGKRTVRRLNDRSAGLAGSDPLGYRSEAGAQGGSTHESAVRLAPYELLRLDIAAP